MDNEIDAFNRDLKCLILSHVFNDYMFDILMILLNLLGYVQSMRVFGFPDCQPYTVACTECVEDTGMADKTSTACYLVESMVSLLLDMY